MASKQWGIEQILDFLDAQSIPYQIRDGAFVYKDGANRVPQIGKDSINAQRIEIAQAIPIEFHERYCTACRGVIRKKVALVSLDGDDALHRMHVLCKTKLGKQFMQITENGDVTWFVEGSEELCFCGCGNKWKRNPGESEGMCASCQGLIQARDRELASAGSRPGRPAIR